MVFPFDTFSEDTFPSIVRDVGARFVADKSDSCSRSAIVEAAIHSLLLQAQNDPGMLRFVGILSTRAGWHHQDQVRFICWVSRDSCESLRL
jgi:hypothetical protein